MRLQSYSRPLAWLALVALFSLPALAGVDRIVIIKADGLPNDLVEKAMRETAGQGREGRSRLPWIQHVFAEKGVWMENFYTRGISLSAPSWSMLDTGRHLEVHGNVEYDRYTSRPYDYLNFFPFYLGYSVNKQADMPGVSLLDEYGIPLLADRFPPGQVYQSFQLYQRGVRWKSLQEGIEHKFKSVKDLFDEWQTGFTIGSSINEETERELIQKLKDPNIHYLDYFTGDFDHTAHLTSDHLAQLRAMEALDAVVGRIWVAIQASPLANSTVLVLVSDHGMNTQNGLYSQGFDLVSWFNSAAGGAHHVITDRHPLSEFKLRGLDPFVNSVTTPSTVSTYLAGQSGEYPTAEMDLDGNERASIGLRSNKLNMLQILLEQLIHKRVRGALRRATIDAFFDIRDRQRGTWRETASRLQRELIALHEHIDAQQKIVDRHPARLHQALEARRETNQLDSMKADARGYSDYLAAMERLLALDPADFDPGKFKVEDFIPPRALGPLNTVGDLQNYAAGPAPDGMVLGAEGSLDMNRSFRHVDYFSALASISVRNNVQRDVSSRPVDFIAVRIPRETIARALPPEDQPTEDAVWLWRGADRQALILGRTDGEGRHELRYLPIANLIEDHGGELHFDRAEWAAGFPLELFEDSHLAIEEGARAQWLSQWHSEREWLRAVHLTQYSDGIIGLTEQLAGPEPAGGGSVWSQYLAMKRRARRTDLLLFANNHWNFNVRSFNPGGNHGSLLRISTHSVLLFAGGKDTGVPRGLRIAEPYDSLSFVPTVLTLMGKPEATLPGPVIQELIRSGTF